MIFNIVNNIVLVRRNFLYKCNIRMIFPSPSIASFPWILYLTLLLPPPHTSMFPKPCTWHCGLRAHSQLSNTIGTCGEGAILRRESTHKQANKQISSSSVLSIYSSNQQSTHPVLFTYVPVLKEMVIQWHNTRKKRTIED